MTEKPPLKEAAERIEARLKAAGFKALPPEPDKANQLQATFISISRFKSAKH